MPQSGTGVSVEAVDPVFQTKMMDMLRQTGRYAFSPSVFHLVPLTQSLHPIDKRLSSVGTTHIPVLAAGYLPSTSTPNNPLNNLHLEPSPSSSILYNPSRARLSSTLSDSSIHNLL